MTEENTTQGLSLDPKTVEVLVANIIPTSKYFESRFDNMQYQINEIKENIKNLETRMERRFEQVEKRFEQVDKRFEQIDKRFEQIDSRFEKIDKRFQHIEDKLDKILERIDRRIDEGLRENRLLSMRLFTFAMTFSAISMFGMLGKMFKLF
ncbi:MAG: hypothetical protein HQK61_06760 [Desulfamplus sp.]|nr:hypothetical protein [Desulfamplus sp.]